jgi:hypothetical protein
LTPGPAIGLPEVVTGGQTDRHWGEHLSLFRLSAVKA